MVQEKLCQLHQRVSALLASAGHDFRHYLADAGGEGYEPHDLEKKRYLRPRSVAVGVMRSCIRSRRSCNSRLRPLGCPGQVLGKKFGDPPAGVGEAATSRTTSKNKGPCALAGWLLVW